MRWRRILVALAVALAVAAIAFTLVPHEPKYEGRTLTEWIKDSGPRRNPDPSQARAVEAVRHIGTNALPWLIKWINAKEPRDWQIQLTRAGRLPRWIRLKLLPSLFGFNSYYAHRRAALDGFLILGPQAAPAVPELLQIIGSTNGSPATGALDSIGIAGLPGALNVLTNRANSIRVRVTAGAWISSVDPRAENDAIAPLMAQCLRDNIPELAPIAARALARRRLEPELTIPIFLTWLTNSNPDTRWGAAYGLRQYGERATSAVPALVIALKDPHPVVRLAAENALFEIDPATLEKIEPGLAELRHWRRTVENGSQSSQ